MKRTLLLILFCTLALVTAGCEAVTGGNYTLRSGETVRGDLWMLGGDATLETGSRVTGTLWMVGGNARANGEIYGDVQMIGGNLDLNAGSVVNGEVHNTGGNVTYVSGARVKTSDNRTPNRTARDLLSLFVIIPFALVIAAVVLIILFAIGQFSPSRQTVPAGTGSGAADSARSSASRSTGSGVGGSVVLAVILIGLGLLFLLQEIFQVDMWRYVWPFVLLVGGLFFFVAMAMGGRDSGRLAIPGSILVMLGLVSLVQSVSDEFQTWAYSWALVFPTAIGIGHYVEGRWTGRLDLRERGIRETTSGLVLFLILAAFFELVLNLSGFFSEGIGRVAFPVLLILVGLLLLFGRLLTSARPTPAAQTPAGIAPAPNTAPFVPPDKPVNPER